MEEYCICLDNLKVYNRPAYAVMFVEHLCNGTEHFSTGVRLLEVSPYIYILLVTYELTQYVQKLLVVY